MTDDLELLRTFEPVLRYTDGELFFPLAVEPYLAACDLLVGSAEGHTRLLVPAGKLDTATLASQTAPAGETLFLRLVQHPLGGLALAQWQRRPGRPTFRAPGRLARVGLAARLVDAGLVTASLLIRGRVPGGTAAAASDKYDAIREQDPRVVYHGRVVREARWVVLHYMFFYAMNDWRSTFEGANDHEADLEQCFVVLEAPRRRPIEPAWFCARPTTRRATICGGAGTTRGWRRSTATRSSTRGRFARDLLRARRIHHAAAVPGDRRPCAASRPVRQLWRDTLAPARPGRPGGTGQARPQRPVRRLRAG